tara:strand:+ start:397 stop:741 length:345 start_codon:yes stop_codon:yes gene_type:complete
MADVQKFRAHESLAVETAGDWQVQSVATVGSTASTVRVDGYHTIHLQSDEDFYFTFKTSSSDALSTSNDLYLKGGDTIYSLKIPHGIYNKDGDEIHLQWERKGGSDCTIRYILG